MESPPDSNTAWWSPAARGCLPYRSNGSSSSYRIVKVLGAGSFGVAVLVDETLGDPRDNDAPVLGQKVIKISEYAKEFLREATTAFAIQTHLLDERRCPNFIRVNYAFACDELPRAPSIGLWDAKLFGIPMPDFMYSTPKIGYLVMESAPHGSITNYGEKAATLNAYEFKSVAFQLVFALAAAQEMGVQHRDITSNNIVLDSWPEAIVGQRVNVYRSGDQVFAYKLHGPNGRRLKPLMIDFGLTRFVETPSKGINYAVTQLIHRAPELLFFRDVDDDLAFTYHSDVFSLGTVLLVLALADSKLRFNAYDAYYDPRIVSALKEHCESLEKGDPTRAVICQDSEEWIMSHISQLVFFCGLPSDSSGSNRAAWWGIRNTPLWENIFSILQHQETAKVGWLQKVVEGKRTDDDDAPAIEKRVTKDGLDLILQMMSWKPKRRGTAKELLAHPYFREFRQEAEDLFRDSLYPTPRYQQIKHGIPWKHGIVIYVFGYELGWTKLLEGPVAEKVEFKHFNQYSTGDQLFHLALIHKRILDLKARIPATIQWMERKANNPIFSNQITSTEIEAARKNLTAILGHRLKVVREMQHTQRKLDEEIEISSDDEPNSEGGHLAPADPMDMSVECYVFTT
jgi:serine/threonine protein kinase